jgi:hypothetical protein
VFSVDDGLAFFFVHHNSCSRLMAALKDAQ